MAARREGHTADLDRHIHERHPHRDRLVGVQWPVPLVLVPRGRAPASFFDEGLIVVEADASDAEERGRYPGKAPTEHEGLNLIIKAPEVDGLKEGLAIGVSLLEGHDAMRALGGGRLDRRPYGRDLAGAGESTDTDMAVPPKGLGEVGQVGLALEFIIEAHGRTALPRRR